VILLETICYSTLFVGMNGKKGGRFFFFKIFFERRKTILLFFLFIPLCLLCGMYPYPLSYMIIPFFLVCIHARIGAHFSGVVPIPSAIAWCVCDCVYPTFFFLLLPPFLRFCIWMRSLGFVPLRLIVLERFALVRACVCVFSFSEMFSARSPLSSPIPSHLIPSSTFLFVLHTWR